METKLKVLLRDYGFTVQGTLIVDHGIPGFVPERVWGKCHSLLDAAERLRPIIREAEFGDRLDAITQERD